MAEYIAIDPNVEAKGTAIMSVIAGLGDQAVPVLEEFDLYPVDVDGWYPQQSWLDAFLKLKKMDFFNEVTIGMRIPDEADWPPGIDSVHAALASIDVAYQMNHRGGEIGGYHYTQESEREGVMMCDNPYPSDFDYGIIYRTVQKFRDAESTELLVIRDTEPCRKNGDDTCIYRIKW